MATATSPTDTPRALRRSLSSYGSSPSPADTMAKSPVSTEPTCAAEGGVGEGKSQRSEEGGARVDSAAFPTTASQMRRSRVLGRPPLSRSRLRELRALSMPDLDKLCGDGFSGPPQPACFKTELEITPRRALGLSSRSDMAGTGASSPRDSSSGTPGSASDDDVPCAGSLGGEHSENSWSLRLVSALLLLFPSTIFLLCFISTPQGSPEAVCVSLSFGPGLNPLTLHAPLHFGAAGLLFGDSHTSVWDEVLYPGRVKLVLRDPSSWVLLVVFWLCYGTAVAASCLPWRGGCVELAASTACGDKQACCPARCSPQK